MDDNNTSGTAEFLKGVARVFVPKQFEDNLGIQRSEPQLSDESRTNQIRIATQQGTNQVMSNPDQYRERIQGIVRDEVQSGNYDADNIKAAVKRNIQMDINNRILSRMNPEEKSFSGFVSNFKRNTGEVVDGIGVLLGLPVELAYKAVTDPVGSAKKVSESSYKMITSPAYRDELYNTYVDPIVEEYKEYRNPWQKFYEDPLDVFLDVSAVFTAGGTAAAKTGAKVAKGTPVVTKTGTEISAQAVRNARDVLRTSDNPSAIRQAAQTIAESRAAKQAGGKATPSRFATQAMKAGAALQKAGTPLRFSNLSKATQALIKKMPGGDSLLADWARAAAIRATLSRSQTSFINTRNRLLNEVDQVVKKLSDEEISVLPRTVEGFEPMPPNASPAFIKAVSLFRSLAKDSERLGRRAGKLDQDVINRRKWTPLANYLERTEGMSFTEKTKVNRQNLQNVRDTAEKSLTRATERFENGKITKAQYEKIRSDIQKKVDQAEQKFDDLLIEEGFASLTGDELRAQLAVIKGMFPNHDPVYMRHFFADKPGKFADFFLNTKPVRSFKPGSLRRSYNRDGYIGQDTSVTRDQLRDILQRQALENTKFEQNMNLIEKLISDPETRPLKAGEDPMPGYAVFAPDGMLRFYRGTMDLSEEMQRKFSQAGAGDIWDDFGKVVDEVFSERGVALTKSYMGVGKAKIYQVPQAKAAELQKMVQATNPIIKIFYDKPLDAFRFAALSLYPRWIYNNIVGNVVFSILNGDVFRPKAFYIAHQAMKNPKLLPDDLFGGVHMVDRTTSGKIGGAVDRISWVKSTVEMHDALLNSPTVGKIVRNIEGGVAKAFKPVIRFGEGMFTFNQYIDDVFKGAAYVNKALREERARHLNGMGKEMQDSFKILEKTTLNAKDRERLLDHVHNWYYYGQNLTWFERRVMRRGVPFYSWMRWSTLYALRIATEAPIRAAIISNMAQDYYMLTGQDQLPEWMRGSVPIATNEDGTVYYLRTSGMNPFSTLNDLFSEGVLGAALRGSAPAVKTAFEQATGRDIFLGERFTKKNIVQAFNGDLYKFDPELGTTVKIEDNEVRPQIIEHALRNFLPQYLILETTLAGGARRYTAEGLDEIFKDIFRDPGERKAIIEDIITKQPVDGTSFARELGKALGVNVMPVKPEQRVARREALERATKAMLNQELPIMNENFKKMLKQAIIDEARKGTPREEISENVKVWIGYNIEELKKIQ